MKKKNKGVQVFISYRREGGRDIARNIYERLSLAGYTTFFDYDSLRNGHFNTQIFEAIEQSSDFILILSKGALERCVDAEDWVRTEIEYALSHHKNIVLVAPEEFDAFPSTMPDSIKAIKSIDIVFLYNKNKHYEQSIAEVKNALTARPTSILNWKLLSVLAAVAVIASGMLTFLFWHRDRIFENRSTHLPLKGYEATLYLMRYSNINLKHDNCLPDHILPIFHYEDSLDDKGTMFIFPKSDYVAYSSGDITKILSISADSIMYHDPVMQVKLHSKNQQTLVLTDATLEIDDWRYDDRPAYRFNSNGNHLWITDEGNGFPYKGTILYSRLHQDEPFTGYKSKAEVELGTATTKLTMASSTDSVTLRGKLSLSNGCDYYFMGSTSSFVSTNPSLPTSGSTIECYHLTDATSQAISLKDFCRSLTKGEVDDDVHFSISSDKSCVFKMRLRMTTSFGDTLYSNYVNIRYNRPRNGKKISICK